MILSKAGRSERAWSSPPIYLVLFGLLSFVLALSSCSGRTGSSSNQSLFIEHPDLQVVISNTASPQRVASIRRIIQESELTRDESFVTRRTFLTAFHRRFAADRRAVDFSARGDHSRSIRVLMRDTKETQRLERLLQHAPGIVEVQDFVGRNGSSDTPTELGLRLRDCVGGSFQLNVFMRDDASQSELDSVREILFAAVGQRQVLPIKRQLAGVIFRCLFGGQETVDPAQLPVMSFLVRASRTTDLDVLAAGLEGLPGVDEVRAQAVARDQKPV